METEKVGVVSKIWITFYVNNASVIMISVKTLKE
jgi:hypothetical protein